MNPNALLVVKDSAPHHKGKTGRFFQMVGPNLDLVSIEIEKGEYHRTLIVVAQQHVGYIPPK